MKQQHPFCLGFCTGSEPHFSPDYSYTGHTKAEVDSLIISPGSSVDFGTWMQSLYGDTAPGVDSNHDGLTFTSDFRFSSDDWKTLGTHMPADSPDREFLQTLFKEHLITNVIRMADSNYHDPDKNVLITSRLLSPQYPATFGQSLRQLKYPGDALGVTYYTNSQQVKNPVDGGAPVKVSAYDPAITEFRGSYVYQQARRNGLRPFYNEFQSGNAAGNSRDNIYRAVFHELQFKPAAINWFCYAGGEPKSNFEWMDCHYMANDLALLRNHLELMQPYQHIAKEPSKLAVFLPVAWPKPVDADRNYEALAAQLQQYAPDVLLTEQIDKYPRYRNMIIVLGFIDGATDSYLQKMLKHIPAKTKVLILCASNRLYCEPGKRGSADLRNSLREVLPLFPTASAYETRRFAVGDGGCELTTSAQISSNPRYQHGSWIRDGAQTVGWRGNQLMMLAGLPQSGLQQVIHSFFGFAPSAERTAGTLHILNGNSVATKPGYYCLAEGQRLIISKELRAYDLVRRQPVSGVVAHPTVVWVLSPNELRVVDSSTARTQLLKLEPRCTSLQITRSQFAFVAQPPRQMTIASACMPTVTVDGRTLGVHKLAVGFYRCDTTVSGLYVVTRHR